MTYIAGTFSADIRNAKIPAREINIQLHQKRLRQRAEGLERIQCA